MGICQNSEQLGPVLNDMQQHQRTSMHPAALAVPSMNSFGASKILNQQDASYTQNIMFTSSKHELASNTHHANQTITDLPQSSGLRSILVNKRSCVDSSARDYDPIGHTRLSKQPIPRPKSSVSALATPGTGPSAQALHKGHLKANSHGIFSNDDNIEKISIQRHKLTGRQNGISNCFAAIALRLPAIRDCSNMIYAEFEKYQHRSSGSVINLISNSAIKRQDLADVMQALTGKLLTETQISKALCDADIQHKKSYAFKDILMCAAFGYYMCVDDEGLSDEQTFIADNFRFVKKAFCQLDSDGSGAIDIRELKKALFSSDGENINALKSTDRAVLENRLTELDLNNDKQISLSEFFNSVVTWSGFAIDED